MKTEFHEVSLDAGSQAQQNENWVGLENELLNRKHKSTANALE